MATKKQQNKNNGRHDVGRGCISPAGRKGFQDRIGFRVELVFTVRHLGILFLLVRVLVTVNVVLVTWGDTACQLQGVRHVDVRLRAALVHLSVSLGGHPDQFPHGVAAELGQICTHPGRLKINESSMVGP